MQTERGSGYSYRFTSRLILGKILILFAILLTPFFVTIWKRIQILAMKLEEDNDRHRRRMLPPRLEKNSGRSRGGKVLP